MRHTLRNIFKSGISYFYNEKLLMIALIVVQRAYIFSNSGTETISVGHSLIRIYTMNCNPSCLSSGKLSFRSFTRRFSPNPAIDQNIAAVFQIYDQWDFIKLLQQSFIHATVKFLKCTEFRLLSSLIISAITGLGSDCWPASQVDGKCEVLFGTVLCSVMYNASVVSTCRSVILAFRSQWEKCKFQQFFHRMTGVSKSRPRNGIRLKKRYDHNFD